MKWTQNSNKTAILFTLMGVLVASALFVGCKSESPQAEKVEAASQQAQKMTDAQLRQKAMEIQQRKGTDPANMTPEERALIGQALVKGLL
jgi:uncharacterized membrane protein